MSKFKQVSAQISQFWQQTNAMLLNHKESLDYLSDRITALEKRPTSTERRDWWLYTNTKGGFEVTAVNPDNPDAIHVREVL